MKKLKLRIARLKSVCLNLFLFKEENLVNNDKSVSSKFIAQNCKKERAIFYPPSSGLSSCVWTADTVMCLHTLCSPAMLLWYEVDNFYVWL